LQHIVKDDACLLEPTVLHERPPQGKPDVIEMGSQLQRSTVLFDRTLEVSGLAIVVA
jgi:hypothetical protein